MRSIFSPVAFRRRGSRRRARLHAACASMNAGLRAAARAFGCRRLQELPGACAGRPSGGGSSVSSAVERFAAGDRTPSSSPIARPYFMRKSNGKPATTTTTSASLSAFRARGGTESGCSSRGGRAPSRRATPGMPSASDRPRGPRRARSPSSGCRPPAPAARPSTTARPASARPAAQAASARRAPSAATCGAWNCRSRCAGGRRLSAWPSVFGFSTPVSLMNISRMSVSGYQHVDRHLDEHRARHAAGRPRARSSVGRVRVRWCSASTHFTAGERELIDVLQSAAAPEHGGGGPPRMTSGDCASCAFFDRGEGVGDARAGGDRGDAGQAGHARPRVGGEHRVALVTAVDHLDVARLALAHRMGEM